MSNKDKKFTINDAIYKTNGKHDECYTPDYAVKPLLQFISKDIVIWCPFDKEDSEYVKIFKQNGNKVINSHLDNNQDFFSYEPNEEWDVIISNPPFSNKRQFFERAMSFNKPFCLLMTAQWLNDAAPVQLFLNHNRNLQLIHFDKRIIFKGYKTQPPFNSIYFCSDFLPKDNILLNLDRK